MNLTRRLSPILSSVCSATTPKVLALVAAVFAVLMIVPGAQAGTVFTADYNLDGGSCCGTGPFGTVELTQDTSITTSVVTVTVTMLSPNGLIQTGSHISFGFGITNDPAITITNISNANFTGAPGGASSPSQGGTWDYVLNCPGCGTGSTNPQSSVSFKVALVSNGTLSINDFTGLFTADIYNGSVTGPVFSDPCTGDCGSVPPESLTPEPLTLGLTGTGLIGIFFLRRKKQA